MQNKQQKRQKYLTIKQYNLLRSLCKMFCYSIFRMRVKGLENIPRNGAFILLSNHQSFLDPIFIGSPVARPTRFVARDSLFKSKIFGAILRMCMAIPIKRGSADINAIKQILRSLGDGLGVGIFPEATRTSDGKINEIKPGFGLLARKSKAVIIPTVIEGAYDCWPRNRKLFLPGEITVYYGKPISFEQLEQLNDQQFAVLITNQLRQMQNICRKAIGREVFEYPILQPSEYIDQN